MLSPREARDEVRGSGSSVPVLAYLTVTRVRDTRSGDRRDGYARTAYGRALHTATSRTLRLPQLSLGLVSQRTLA